ncbi:nucleotidyltransferase domain-containing protein [Candidatus Omnitrophota bacterium]
MKQLTKNRAELLRLFFTNPNKSFYMQEIGRILGKKPGTFQRTLNNLVMEGILGSEYKANARYFKANKKYSLFKEFKSIVSKTIGVEGSLREIIEKTKRIKASFIYGSFAQNKENTASDIDILIVGNPDEDKLMQRIEDLEKRLQREINYNIYPIEEFKQKLRKKDSFVSNILKRPRVILKGSLDEI